MHTCCRVLRETVFVPFGSDSDGIVPKGLALGTLHNVWAPPLVVPGSRQLLKDPLVSAVVWVAELLSYLLTSFFHG